MYRKIEKQLCEWKQQENKKPLLIKGARQVGKTYAIREFSRQNYDHVIEINFELDKDFVDVFEKSRKPEEIIVYIEIKHLDIEFQNGEIFFFLDEI